MVNQFFHPPPCEPNAQPDPRPQMPLYHHAPTLGRVLARTDWSPSASSFTFKCSFITINHQLGDAGQFGFCRKGEWLLKEQSGYTTDNVGSAPQFHNTLAIQNTSSAGPSATPAALQWFEPVLLQHGAQWKEGQGAGDPASSASFAADYVYAGGDMRNLYNRPSPTPDSNFMDVTLATRSTLWLKPEAAVITSRRETSRTQTTLTKHPVPPRAHRKRSPCGTTPPSPAPDAVSCGCGQCSDQTQRRFPTNGVRSTLGKTALLSGQRVGVPPSGGISCLAHR